MKGVRVANAVTLLATTAIHANTPVGEYAAVRDLENAAAMTMVVAGPFHVMGLAVKASSLWNIRLQLLGGKVDDLVEHAPALHTRLLWCSAGVTLSVDPIAMLKEHIGSAPWYHAVLYEGAPAVLTNTSRRRARSLPHRGRPCRPMLGRHL